MNLAPYFLLMDTLDGILHIATGEAMKCSSFLLFRAFLLCCTVSNVTSFIINNAVVRHWPHRHVWITSCRRSASPNEKSGCRKIMGLHDVSGASTFWSAVEFFDGSTIVDPVVVSNVFWARLQSNMLSFVLGQFLAAVVFTILLSLARSQLTKLFNFVSEKFISSSADYSGRQQINVPPNLRDGYVRTIQPDFGKLLVCVAIDVIGSSSTLIPILGDASDALWAPAAGLLLRSLFNGSNVVFALEFAEEILPLTDILPLATLCWIIDTFFQDSSLASLLQLGIYSASSGNRLERFDAIDVDPIDFPSKKDKGGDS